jgi:hypothetical protein
MITTKRPKKTKIEIDLQGPEGNAFALLGIAKDLAHKLNMDCCLIVRSLRHLHRIVIF